MALRRKKTLKGTISLIKIAERSQENWAENLRKLIAKEFVRNAKAWRLEAKRLLSGPCASRFRPNTTEFPGRCSGDLERSLQHRTYILRRQKTSVVAGWRREFTGTVNSKGKDYSKILNDSSKPYGGYQQRIYNSLDARLSKIMAKYTETDVGRKAWQRT